MYLIYPFQKKVINFIYKQVLNEKNLKLKKKKEYVYVLIVGNVYFSLNSLFILLRNSNFIISSNCFFLILQLHIKKYVKISLD